MEFVFSQELKNEIDGNLSIYAELTEFINNIKADKGELGFDCVDVFREKFRGLENKSFDDLSSYITQLYYDKVIAKNEMPVIGEALNSVYYENRDKFVSDSEELRTVIEKVYKELCPLGKIERAKYFSNIENELSTDKYKKYIYSRVHSCLNPPIMLL